MSTTTQISIVTISYYAKLTMNLYLCSKWPQEGTCDGILDVWISYDKILQRKYTKLTWKDCWPPIIIVIAHALSLVFALVLPLCTGFDIFCYFFAKDIKGISIASICTYLAWERQIGYLIAYWAICMWIFCNKLEKKMRLRVS